MSKRPSNDARKTIVVIGHGMVGHRFCEKMVEFDTDRQYKIVTFCEEPRAAYDRVGLTSFFAHRDAEKLMLARLDWYRDNGIDLHVGDRANRIDRKERVVVSGKGCRVDFDIAILATGSYPFLEVCGGSAPINRSGRCASDWARADPRRAAGSPGPRDRCAETDSGGRRPRTPWQAREH